MRVGLIIILCFPVLVFGQIANFGFENWSMRDSTLQPDGWQTNNNPQEIYVKRVDTLLSEGVYSLYISNETSAFEASPAELETYFIPTSLKDTLSIRLKRVSNDSFFTQSYFILRVVSPSTNDFFELSFSDTIVPNWQLFNLPISFSTMPDSVRLSIFAGCTCMIPVAGIFIDEIYLKSSGLSLFPLSIKKFSVFPNPTQKYLNLQGNFSRNAKVTCYNTAGQLFRLERLASNRLDVSGLPKGVYFLEIKEEGERSTVKFIKE